VAEWDDGGEFVAAAAAVAADLVWVE